MTEHMSACIRYIDMLQCLPLGRWVTTSDVHDQLLQKGYLISRRTVQRDLIRFSKRFKIDIADNRGGVPAFNDGRHGSYEWRRLQSLELAA